MLSGILVARMDSVGDVLLTGPLTRACAAEGPVTYLCSPAGAAAAGLLPGVDAVIVGRAPWIEGVSSPVERGAVEDLVDAVRAAEVHTAVVATSFHQSPLPLALLLRLAGVRTIGAISVDYPGSLLDVRHHVDDDIHEVERSLSLGAAMGFHLQSRDDGSLMVRPELLGAPPAGLPAAGYVVVHPGASVTARAWSPVRDRELVERLLRAGRDVVVTGGRDETALTASVAAPGALDLGGCVNLAGLAGVLAGAGAVVVGNTGPAHLAAAVGTPVVSLYAPTVPAVRWRPWRVDHVLLGRQDIGCGGCRARTCPVPGHPCIDEVPVGEVTDAVEKLAARRTPARSGGGGS